MSRPNSPAPAAPPRDVVVEAPAAPTPTGPSKVKGKGTKSSSQPKMSLPSVMDLPNDAHNGQGVYHGASVVPDTRFFILAVCTYIGRLFSSTDYESSQFVTPPSLIAYTLFVLYFHLYYTDMHSRSPSFYARNFVQFHRHSQFLRIFEKAYIPDEIFVIIQNLNAWKPELMNNFEFLPTLAHTLAEYDIPYLMHPLIFLHGHNTLFNRADSVGHIGRFLSQRIFTGSFGPINDRRFTIGNLLGCIYDDGTNAQLVQNWLSRVILPFVDPATHRQHLRRTGLAKFDLTEMTGITTDNFNPYTFLFSTTHNRNFEAMLDCVSAGSEFMKTQFNATKTIMDLVPLASHAPGSYMIMSYTSPTWTTSSIDPTHFTPNVEITPGTYETLHDTHTRFGIAPTMPRRNDNQLTFPPASPTDRTAHPDLIQALYHVSVTANSTATSPVPEHLTTQDRDEMRHSTPDVLVFHPGDSTADASFWPMVSGIVVHNGNIDSNIVKTPNPTDDLPLILSRYLDGFVSLRVIRPRFTGRATYLIMRTALERVTYDTLGLLYRSDRVDLPAYDVPRNAPNMGGHRHLLWPFHWLANVFTPLFGMNLFTNNLQSGAAPTDATLIQVADAWSSFRISSDHEARPTTNTTFMGINHGEIIFGRNSTIKKHSHPSDLLRRV